MSGARAKTGTNRVAVASAVADRIPIAVPCTPGAAMSRTGTDGVAGPGTGANGMRVAWAVDDQRGRLVGIEDEHAEIRIAVDPGGEVRTTPVSTNDDDRARVGRRRKDRRLRAGDNASQGDDGEFGITRRMGRDQREGTNITPDRRLEETAQGMDTLLAPAPVEMPGAPVGTGHHERALGYDAVEPVQVIVELQDRENPVGVPIGEDRGIGQRPPVRVLAVVPDAQVPERRREGRNVRIEEERELDAGRIVDLEGVQDLIDVQGGAGDAVAGGPAREVPSSVRGIELPLEGLDVLAGGEPGNVGRILARLRLDGFAARGRERHRDHAGAGRKRDPGKVSRTGKREQGTLGRRFLEVRLRRYEAVPERVGQRGRIPIGNEERGSGRIDRSEPRIGRGGRRIGNRRRTRPERRPGPDRRGNGPPAEGRRTRPGRGSSPTGSARRSATSTSPETSRSTMSWCTDSGMRAKMRSTSHSCGPT